MTKSSEFCPFDHTDYRSTLLAYVHLHQDQRGLLGQLAKAMDVHSSYLTRILHEEAHLTPDQAAKLCDYWALPTLQAEYFLNMVDFERAGSRPLKDILSRRLEALRRQHEDLGRRFEDAELVNESSRGIYYSVWYYSAIHILLLVPGHAKIHQIASRLGLPEGVVASALAVLRSLQLAEEKNGNWRTLSNNIHMPNSALWASAHHANWRQHAIQRVSFRDPESICFTGIHSMSRRDFNKIKQILLTSLEQTKKVITPSPDEELYYLLIDFNKV